MLCVKNSTFTLLLNGCPVGDFTPSRGLRQGDPISPYIFILCSEVLSKLILRFCNEDKVKGIKLNWYGPEISHHLFDDDLILYGWANVKVAKGMLNCLNNSWSGQKVNNTKSSIYLSKNTYRTMAISMNSFFGYQRLKESSKHLGLPILLNRRRVGDWQYLANKIIAKILGWKAKVISKAGRLTLISSVGQAMSIIDSFFWFN